MEKNNYQKNIFNKLNDLENQIIKNGDKPLSHIKAAEYLGYSKSYLYKLTSKKIIPHHKPTGKIILFLKSELDHWIINSNKGE